MKNISKNKKGFSLIETLIAVSILMIAIAGPLSLVQAGLFSSNHQRNQVTAIYLAQEAIEFIKNVRDGNSYTQYDTTSYSWLRSPDAVGALPLLSTTVPTNPGQCNGLGCYVDPHKGSGVFVKPVYSGSNLFLNLNITNGISTYSYATAGTPTTFQRIVKISQNSNDEATITVTVYWTDHGLQRSYTISDIIYKYASQI